MIKLTDDRKNGVYLFLRIKSNEYALEIRYPELTPSTTIKEISEDRQTIETFRLDPSLTQRENNFINRWFNNGYTDARIYRCDSKLREELNGQVNPQEDCPLQVKYATWNKARLERTRK